MTTTENPGAHRAGRLLLAIADDDMAQVAAILREAAEHPAGVLTLVVQVASVANESARALAGDDWRSVMTTALHEVELEGIADD